MLSGANNKLPTVNKKHLTNLSEYDIIKTPKGEDAMTEKNRRKQQIKADHAKQNFIGCKPVRQESKKKYDRKKFKKMLDN